MRVKGEGPEGFQATGIRVGQLRGRAGPTTLAQADFFVT